MRVLVTGGTGVLGRQVVRLLDGKAEVRVLSRRPNGQPGFIKGDLDTGEGLAAASDGVDVIAHCASPADYRRPQRDVEGTRRLLEATRGQPHVVYASLTAHSAGSKSTASRPDRGGGQLTGRRCPSSRVQRVAARKDATAAVIRTTPAPVTTASVCSSRPQSFPAVIRRCPVSIT
jgi:nucleoside-diphosphate-sugar epimerase